MWDTNLIESNPKSKSERGRWGAPLSMLVHGAVAFTLISVSYWQVEAIQAPAIPLILYREAAPPSPPSSEQATVRPPLIARSQAQQITRIVPLTSDNPVESEPANEPVRQDAVGEGEGEQDGSPYGVPGALPGFGDSGSGFLPFGSGAPEAQPPIIVTADMQRPVLIHRVEPEYPELARRLGIQGTVILEAVIGTSGAVEDLRVLRSAHPLLDQAAIKGVRDWRYQPASLQGRPVRVYFTVTVAFKLKQ